MLDQQGKLVSTVTLEVDPNPSHPDQDASHRFRPKAPSSRSGSQASHVPLTGREKEVLRLVAQGATNLEIAELLELSPHTVKSNIISIFNKLAVNDRTQAAVWAFRQNLI